MGNDNDAKGADDRVQQFLAESATRGPDPLPLEEGFEDRVRQRLIARRLEQANAAEEFYKLAWKAVPVAALTSCLVFVVATFSVSGGSPQTSMDLTQTMLLWASF